MSEAIEPGPEGAKSASPRSQAVSGVAIASFAMGGIYVMFGASLIFLGVSLLQEASQASMEPASRAGWMQAVPPFCCLDFIGPFAKFVGTVLGLVLGMCGVSLAILSSPFFFAGHGLMERRPWSRTLAVVLGCIAAIVALQSFVSLVAPSKPNPDKRIDIVMPDKQGKPVPVMSTSTTEPERSPWLSLVLLVSHGGYSALALSILLRQEYAAEFTTPKRRAATPPSSPTAENGPA